MNEILVDTVCFHSDNWKKEGLWIEYIKRDDGWKKCVTNIEYEEDGTQIYQQQVEPCTAEDVIVALLLGMCDEGTFIGVHKGKYGTIVSAQSRVPDDIRFESVRLHRNQLKAIVNARNSTLKFG